MPVGKLKRITQMPEWLAMTLGSVGLAGIVGGATAAATLKLAPRNKIITYAAAATAAHLLLVKLISTGNLTPSNRRSAAAMEMWMRRLDAFVHHGKAERESVDGSPLLLTPLAVVTGSSSGLGLITTENLLACGWKVIMPNYEPAEKAREEAIKKAQNRIAQRYKSVKEKAAKHRVQQLIAMIGQNAIVTALNVAETTSINKCVAEIVAFDEEAGAIVEVVVGGTSSSPAAAVSKISNSLDSDASPISISSPTNFPTVTSGTPPLSTYHDGLRLLMNNAGIFKHGYGRWSKEGVEGVFNVNYAGPVYMTHLIKTQIIDKRGGGTKGDAQNQGSSTDTINSTANTPFRIVNTASCANLWAFGMNTYKNDSNKEGMKALTQTLLDALLDPTQNDTNNMAVRKMKETYGISKLGMMAHAFNTARLFEKEHTAPRNSVFAIHPGGVSTLVFRDVNPVMRILFHVCNQIVFKTPRQGASNQTYAALVLLESLVNSASSDDSGADPLTASIIAANADTTGISVASSIPKRLGGPKAGDLTRSLVVKDSCSGKFLLDIGEGCGGAVSDAACPEIYALFDAWSQRYIAKASASE